MKKQPFNWMMSQKFTGTALLPIVLKLKLMFLIISVRVHKFNLIKKAIEEGANADE